MRRRRLDRIAAGVDGGVLIKPQEWISLWDDLPADPSISVLTGWMTACRGRVLTKIFELENDLIYLAIDAEFLGAINPIALASKADRELSYREDHSLERKIERAKPIAREHLTKDRADHLIQDLASCRILRNLMAHYPCWLEPINDEEAHRTTGFKLFIADRDHVWNIEQRDVDEWDRLFLDTRRAITCLRFLLHGRPEPEFVPGTATIVSDGPNENGDGTTADIPWVGKAIA